MKGYPTMRLDDPYPVLSSRSVVLLICFMPLSQECRPQWVLLTMLADSLKTRLVDRVRVLRIDKATHPDVVQSFAITQTPTFILVRWGVELWRQVGLSDEATLCQRIYGELAPDLAKNQGV